MGNACRDPDRAVCGHNPSPNFRANRHHSTGCVHKLIAVVKMPPDIVAGRIVAHEGGDVGVLIGQAIKNCALSCLRHLLSEYRLYAASATATL